jgi:hypothetical protein
VIGDFVMNIRNVLISILFVGVSTILIGCSNQCKDRYIWSPRTIIITPEEVRVNDLIIMDGNVLISRSGFSWYDYKTSQKAGVPYCWPKND